MNVEWQEILALVQDKIEPNADQWYTMAYREQEIGYWYHIANWIWNDSQVNEINRVIDIGAAYGSLCAYAKTVYGCEAHAVDIVKIVSDETLEDFKIKFTQADIELDVPKIFKPKSYDRILFTEIIEHLYFNPVPTLQKLNEMLKDDGILFLSTPDACTWGRVGDFYQHVGDMPLKGSVEKPPFEEINRHTYQYSDGELRRIFDEAGFKVLFFNWSDLNKNNGKHLNYGLVKKEPDVTNV